MGEEDGDARTLDIVVPVISEEEVHVMEWEVGLPSSEDLIPLSQLLITPELASAFSITLEPSRTSIDVSRASHITLSSLRTIPIPPFPIPEGLIPLPSFGDRDESTDSRKGRKFDTIEEPGDDQSARMLKRPRLVWTPQLHKRFIDVVAHLGIKNAFPKTIMQMMNVDGLTRENVASHLQKYRLYLKRMQGMPNESPSSASAQIPMPYVSSYLSMPVLGLPGNGHFPAMADVRNPAPSGSSYRGSESHQYNSFSELRRDWLGDSFRSIPCYPHVAPSDK